MWPGRWVGSLAMFGGVIKGLIIWGKPFWETWEFCKLKTLYNLSLLSWFFIENPGPHLGDLEGFGPRDFVKLLTIGPGGGCLKRINPCPFFSTMVTIGMGGALGG